MWSVANIFDLQLKFRKSCHATLSAGRYCKPAPSLTSPSNMGFLLEEAEGHTCRLNASTVPDMDVRDNGLSFQQRCPSNSPALPPLFHWWRGGGRAAERCARISVQRNVFLHTQWLVMGTARTMCNCSLEGGFVSHYGNTQERGDGWWGCCGNVPLQRAPVLLGLRITGLTLCRKDQT